MTVCMCVWQLPRLFENCGPLPRVEVITRFDLEMFLDRRGCVVLTGEDLERREEAWQNLVGMAGKRVPFQKSDNKAKPLVPIRCPFPDHDRGGMPLRFGLGQDKDKELQAKILKDMKVCMPRHRPLHHPLPSPDVPSVLTPAQLGDINSFVEEASKVEAPLSARWASPIRFRALRMPPRRTGAIVHLKIEWRGSSGRPFDL